MTTDPNTDAPSEAGAIRLRSPARSLPIQLLRAREAVMDRFRATLRMFGVTEQQWRLLRTLSETDGMEVSELAEASLLLAPSASRILRDLELRGLLRKETVARDQRRARVVITAEGLDLIGTVAPYSEAIHTEIVEAFGAERADQLVALLEELAARMQALPPATHDAAAGGRAPETERD